MIAWTWRQPGVGIKALPSPGRAGKRAPSKYFLLQSFACYCPLTVVRISFTSFWPDDARGRGSEVTLGSFHWMARLMVCSKQKVCVCVCWGHHTNVVCIACCYLLYFFLAWGWWWIRWGGFREAWTMNRAAKEHLVFLCLYVLRNGEDTPSTNAF